MAHRCRSTAMFGQAGAPTSFPKPPQPFGFLWVAKLKAVRERMWCSTDRHYVAEGFVHGGLFSLNASSDVNQGLTPTASPRPRGTNLVELLEQRCVGHRTVLVHLCLHRLDDGVPANLVIAHPNNPSLGGDVRVGDPCPDKYCSCPSGRSLWYARSHSMAKRPCSAERIPAPLSGTPGREHLKTWMPWYQNSTRSPLTTRPMTEALTSQSANISKDNKYVLFRRRKHHPFPEIQRPTPPTGRPPPP